MLPDLTVLVAFAEPDGFLWKGRDRPCKVGSWSGWDASEEGLQADLRRFIGEAHMDLESSSGPESGQEPSGNTPSGFSRLVMLMTSCAGLIAAVAALITAIRS